MFFKLLLSRDVVLNALKVALVVGSALVAI